MADIPFSPDTLADSFTATPVVAPAHATSINIHLDPRKRRCTVTVSPSRETITIAIEGAPCFGSLDED